MPRFKNSWSIGYGVTINGKHSFGTYKLILTNNDVNETPTPKTSYVSVPGSSKIIDLSEVISGQPVYDSRKLKFNFAAGNNPETWPARYSKFLNDVHGKHVKLILDNDNLWYYEGRADVSGFNRKTEIGTFKMDAECEPFKKFLYGVGEPWKWDDFMFGGIGWLIFILSAASIDSDYSLDRPFSFQRSIASMLDLTSDGSLDITDARRHIRIEIGLDEPPVNKLCHVNREGEGQYQSNVIMAYDRVYVPLSASSTIDGKAIDKTNGEIIDASGFDNDHANKYHVKFYNLNSVPENFNVVYISGRIKGRTSLYAISTGNSIQPNSWSATLWDELSGKRDKEHEFAYRLDLADTYTILAVGYYGSTAPVVGAEICPGYLDVRLTNRQLSSQRDVYCTYYDFVNVNGKTTGYSVHGIDINGATDSHPVDVKIYAPYDNVLNFYSETEIQDSREYFDNDGLLLSPTLPKFKFTATDRANDRIVVKKIIDNEVVAGGDDEFVMAIPSDSDVYSLDFTWPEFILGNDDNIMIGNMATKRSRYITLRFTGTGNVKIEYTPRML